MNHRTRRRPLSEIASEDERTAMRRLVEQCERSLAHVRSIALHGMGHAGAIQIHLNSAIDVLGRANDILINAGARSEEND